MLASTMRLQALNLSSWDYASNVRYAQTAENVGFEYALTQIRFMAGYGAVSVSENQVHVTNDNFRVLGKSARICLLLSSDTSRD
jgi:hypothetical protein